VSLYESLTALNMILVEGDPLLSDALLQFFRTKGCPVLVFSSAEKALQAMEKDRFDVVISDHSLPGLDGVTFLMRARRLQPDTIRILLTDYPPPMAAHSHQRGQTNIDDVIRKPLTITELESSLRRLLEASPKVLNTS